MNLIRSLLDLWGFVFIPNHSGHRIIFQFWVCYVGGRGELEFSWVLWQMGGGLFDLPAMGASPSSSFASGSPHSGLIILSGSRIRWLAGAVFPCRCRELPAQAYRFFPSS